MSSPQLTEPSDAIAEVTRMNRRACQSLVVFCKHFESHKSSKSWYTRLRADSREELFLRHVSEQGNAYMAIVGRTYNESESIRVASSTVISELGDHHPSGRIVPTIKLQISRMHTQIHSISEALQDLRICMYAIMIGGGIDPTTHDTSTTTLPEEGYTELEARAAKNLPHFAKSVLEYCISAIHVLFEWWNQRLLHGLSITEILDSISDKHYEANSEAIALLWKETESECASYVEEIKVEHELMESGLKGIMRKS